MKLIAEAETSQGLVEVVQRDDGLYDILTNGVNFQPGHDAHGVIRALCGYLHAEGYVLDKLQKTK